MSVFSKHKVEIGEKNHVGFSGSIESQFLIWPGSKTQSVITAEEKTTQSTTKVLENTQNHASALLYVSIKRSSLKILRHLALFFRAFKFCCETGMCFPIPARLPSKFYLFSLSKTKGK